MATSVKAAVEGGDYASTSEVVREALRDWKRKRSTQGPAFATLKADIEKGLADVHDFDTKDIVARGRKLLARHSRSG